MSQTTVVADLTALLKLEPKETESADDFAARLARKANDIKDDDWQTLEEKTQEWVNAALSAIEKGKPVPLPEGLEAVDGDDEDEDTTEEVVKVVKKKEKVAKPKTRGKRFASSDKITILVKANPYRANTQSAAWFDNYKPGMTVKDAVEAGTPRHHIRWDQTRGNIKIAP